MSAPAPEHIPYKITAQEKTQRLGQNGVFEDVWRVSYVGPRGVHSSIEVPVEEYEPAEVDRKIEAELENVTGVHELGPEPHPENTAE